MHPAPLLFAALRVGRNKPIQAQRWIGVSADLAVASRKRPPSLTPRRAYSGLLLALIAAYSSLLLVGNAHAEAPKQDAAVQQVLRKAQGAIRQLSEEKTKLEADNAALQKDKAALQEQIAKLEASVKQLEPLPAEIDKQKALIEGLQKDKAGLEGQLTQGRDREQGLHGKLKNTVGLAKQIRADNQLLVAAVKEREEWIARCQQKNTHLAELQEQIIHSYEEKGVWEAMADAEPLTGIAHVKTENAAQDYQFKLDDLKATPFQTEVKAPTEPAKAGQALPKEDDEDDE
jgi:DNA repair exonuclease SbcCD ATPase subunit